MRDHVFDSAMPRIALAALITALVLLALAVSMTATDAATKQPPKSIVLGRTINTPDSGCPNSGRCQVVARVTGIQMQADGTQELFRAPSDGRVVAWWLRLPALTKAQIKSFSDLFGGGPSAQIAVLRRGKLGRARLVGESPVQALDAFLVKKGTTRFRLAKALRIKEGDYVGLTAVTWVPAFAVGLNGDENSWLASRPKARCNTPPSSDRGRFMAYYKQTDAHSAPNSVRPYRCTYKTARLLYWARVVPNAPQQQTGGSPPPPGS